MSFLFKIPKSGFINVLDFNSPKHLAEYLNYLDKNKTAYNSYFKWKKYISNARSIGEPSSLCAMCIRLQLEEFFGFKKTRIDDIESYWSPTRSNCKRPKIINATVFDI